MAVKHIRGFEIKKTRFHLTDRGDGTLQITSIHPYDETEYHYAVRATKYRWGIYREGHIVTTITENHEITPEAIAYCLLRADHDAKLVPRNAIW